MDYNKIYEEITGEHKEHLKDISLKDMQEELNKIGKKDKLFTLEDYINILTEEEKKELGRRYRVDRKKRKGDIKCNDK